MSQPPSRNPLVVTMVIPDIMPSTHVSTEYGLSVIEHCKPNSPPGLYQKIDPKVREARRKKFFGSGRRRRSTVDEDFREVHLDSEPRQQKERDGAAQINRQGLHSCKFHTEHCSALLSTSVLSQLLLGAGSFIIPHIDCLPGQFSRCANIVSRFLHRFDGLH